MQNDKISHKLMNPLTRITCSPQPDRQVQVMRPLATEILNQPYKVMFIIVFSHFWAKRITQFDQIRENL